MNKNMKNNIVKFTAVSLVGMAMFVMAACGEKRSEGQNMIVLEEGFALSRPDKSISFPSSAKA